VRERLGAQSDAVTESETLDLADARTLIARSNGFKDWGDLVEQVEG
jgi:hypothetical protein